MTQVVDLDGFAQAPHPAWFDIDDTGAILGESLVYRNGHAITIPPEDGALSNPPIHSWDWEVNNSDAILHLATFFPITGGSDQVLLLGENAVFQEDKVGPVGTRTNKYVHAAHLNDHGQWAALVGFTDGDLWAQMLVRDGVKAIELGDALPNGSILETLSESVYIDNEGDIYWVGTWTNADATTSSGLFLNDAVLIENGVTELDGHPLSMDIGGDTGDWEHDRRTVSRAELIGIMRPRVEEILEEVRARLDAAGFEHLPSQQIVLTGGGSQIQGLDALASRILG